MIRCVLQGLTVQRKVNAEGMTKSYYINAISAAGDRGGNLLLELMDLHHVSNLREITEEQAKEYYEKRVKK